MVDMQLDYFILEDSWCSRGKVIKNLNIFLKYFKYFKKDGCSLPVVYDLEDVAYRGNKPTCKVVKETPEPYFTSVFKNVHYNVLKVNANL